MEGMQMCSCIVKSFIDTDINEKLKPTACEHGNVERKTGENNL
jgi:hypothetical protein